MSLDKAEELLFKVIRTEAKCATLKAMRAPIEMLNALFGKNPANLTLKMLVMADVAGAFNRDLALLMDKGTDTIIKKGVEEETILNRLLDRAQNLSPELILYASLVTYFQSVKSKDPILDAAAMLKTLGHEIPETLVPGLEEGVRA